MTGYTVHTGSNKKFIAGWDQIFQGTTSTKSQKGKVVKKSVSPEGTDGLKSKKKTSAKKKAAKSSRRSQ